MTETIIITIAIFVGVLVLYLRIADRNRNGHNQKPNKQGGRKYNFFGQEDKLHRLFSERFQFYKTIEPAQRKDFVERVILFIHTSIFFPKNNIELTPDMVSMISASFVHLSFGMSKKVLTYFNYINIYPEKFFSDVTKHYHKGDVNIQGSISISWTDFQQGYQNKEDGFNLGLHELAHAMSFEIMKERNEYPALLNTMKPVFVRARKEIQGKIPRNHLLREYAFRNPHEYFAVATEFYFERNQELQDEYPELFSELKAFYHPDHTVMH